jgi:hypothetical protein
MPFKGGEVLTILSNGIEVSFGEIRPEKFERGEI